MPYPNSPFTDTFQSLLITSLEHQNIEETISGMEYQKLMSWLCSSPKISSYRVNTLKYTTQEITEIIQTHLDNANTQKCIRVNINPILPDIVIVHNEEVDDVLKRHKKEIIVDSECACAVLRGAHIYAPGVLGMTSGTQIDENVSVYCDLNKMCKRGLQRIYKDDKKLFIANGVVKMQRYQLFGDNITPSGTAIEVIESISGCPALDTDKFLPPGSALLQNVPSVVCVLALNPQPGEIVLDMCASPGNKTTHICELMKNEGTVIAIDKTPKKVDQLKTKCAIFGAEVYSFVADSTKIMLTENDSSCTSQALTDGPPFRPECFDRILLDAPCSVLGKRPQLVNRMSEKEIRSYVPLQRKLFATAVQLLKPTGSLVYSTCTITLAENEGIVSWALKTFENLELVKPKICLGGPGWPGTALTQEYLNCVQRFGPDQDVDSVGFFFACFTKK